jgi:hypothetical protein
MECKQQINNKICNCTYEGCSRKGICCDCIRYHLKHRELPACCFPENIENTFDRSFERFAEAINNKEI